MHHEDDNDNLCEHQHDAVGLSGVRHIQEYTKDVERQQRDEHLADRNGNHFLEVIEYLPEAAEVGHRDAQSHDKGEYQSAHDIEQWRDVEHEVRHYLHAFFRCPAEMGVGYHVREQPRPCPI